MVETYCLWIQFLGWGVCSPSYRKACSWTASTWFQRLYTDIAHVWLVLVHAVLSCAHWTPKNMYCRWSAVWSVVWDVLSVWWLLTPISFLQWFGSFVYGSWFNELKQISIFLYRTANSCHSLPHLHLIQWCTLRPYLTCLTISWSFLPSLCRNAILDTRYTSCGLKRCPLPQLTWFFLRS